MASQKMIAAYFEAIHFTNRPIDESDAELEAWDNATFSNKARESAGKDLDAFLTRLKVEAPALLEATDGCYIAHDFWYTRNGFGAGFWENDYGTKIDCDIATAIAHQFGEVYTYVDGANIEFDR